MMIKTRFDSLSDSTRAELAELTPEQVQELAIDVHVQRRRARAADYPSDPQEALAELRRLARGASELKIDDRVQHVLHSLVTLRLAMIGGIEGDHYLDDLDLTALVYLIDQSVRMLREHDQVMIELSERLHQVRRDPAPVCVSGSANGKPARGKVDASE